jgi:hypothetical protein
VAVFTTTTVCLTVTRGSSWEALAEIQGTVEHRIDVLEYLHTVRVCAPGQGHRIWVGHWHTHLLHKSINQLHRHTHLLHNTAQIGYIGTPICSTIQHKSVTSAHPSAAQYSTNQLHRHTHLQHNTAQISYIGTPICSTRTQISYIGTPICSTRTQIGYIGTPICSTRTQIGYIGTPICSTNRLQLWLSNLFPCRNP